MSEEQHQELTEGNRLSPEDQVYQIRLKGHLNGSWSEWLSGFTVAHEKDGTTVLTGPLADQSALHGLLIKIRDLGLPLLAVQRMENEQ
jgi:hypothetical protein